MRDFVKGSTCCPFDRFDYFLYGDYRLCLAEAMLVVLEDTEPVKMSHYITVDDVFQ